MKGFTLSGYSGRGVCLLKEVYPGINNYELELAPIPIPPMLNTVSTSHSPYLHSYGCMATEDGTLEA